jgi:hypothetical protein
MAMTISLASGWTYTAGTSITSGSVSYSTGDLMVAICFGVVVGVADSHGNIYGGPYGGSFYSWTATSTGSSTVTLTSQNPSTFNIGIAVYRCQNALISSYNSTIAGTTTTSGTYGCFYTTSFNSAGLFTAEVSGYTGSISSSSLSGVSNYNQSAGIGDCGVSGYIAPYFEAIGTQLNLQLTNGSSNPTSFMSYNGVEIYPAPMVANPVPASISVATPRPTSTLNILAPAAPAHVLALPASIGGYLPPASWAATSTPALLPVLPPSVTGTNAPPTPVTANPIPAMVPAFCPPAQATISLGPPVYATGSNPSQGSFSWWVQTRPICYATGSGQLLPNATWTTLPMTATVLDRAGGMTLATGHYLLGLDLGYYWVDGSVTFAASTLGSSRQVTLNGQFTTPGGVNMQTQWYSKLGPYSGVTVNAGRRLVLATTSTDWVGLQAYQDIGSGMNLQSAFLYVEFAGHA